LPGRACSITIKGTAWKNAIETELTTRKGAEKLFLPDFCGLRMVLVAAVLAELLALVLTLAIAWQPAEFWDRLGLATLYVEWIVLASAAVLCLARRYMYSLGNLRVAVVSYVLILSVAGACAGIAWWLSVSSLRGVMVIQGTSTGFVLRTLVVTAIVALLALRYFFVRHQWQAKVRSELTARIQSLQSRIRPHFLFNSLNTVASLTRTQPALAEQAVLDLADMFRASLADARNRITLADELVICRNYLDLEKLRLGERLAFELAVEDLPDDLLLPPLTLQPLLENAVCHGLEGLPGGGTIRLSGHMGKGRVTIRVENPVANTQPDDRCGGNHVALDNIRERLFAWHADSARLSAGPEGDGWRVELVFPCERAS